MSGVVDDEGDDLEGPEEEHVINLWRLKEVAEANGLTTADLIEVALNPDTFGLLVPEKDSGEWEPLSHPSRNSRAPWGYVEIDRTDPDARRLCERGWALVRVIRWSDDGSSFVPFRGGHRRDGSPILGPRAMVSRQVVKAEDILVRDSGVPHDILGGGVCNVGLTLPDTSQRVSATQAFPSSVDPRKEESMKMTIKALALALAQATGAFHPDGRPIAERLVKAAAGTITEAGRERTLRRMVEGALK